MGEIFGGEVGLQAGVHGLSGPGVGGKMSDDGAVSRGTGNWPVQVAKTVREFQGNLTSMHLLSVFHFLK